MELLVAESDAFRMNFSIENNKPVQFNLLKVKVIWSGFCERPTW